jgi:glycosyltransferase involved in cell wall biosynthesis
VPGAIAHDANVWVDSLYFAQLPDLQGRAPQHALQLVVHYLPSQVERSRTVEWHELSAVERAAFEHAAGFLVTSRFMAQQLARFPLGERRVLCVEPGVDLPVHASGAPSGGALRASMLCNVTEGKGVLALLDALAVQVRDGDRFRLSVAGSLDIEPAYAQTCARAIAAQSRLHARIVLCGSLRHPEAMALLQHSDVLISASRMEAYGMALAEARAAGVPIVARNAGNASALVAQDSGGALVANEREVAAELLALARDPARLAARRALASAARLTRSWHDAAADFCVQLSA